MLDPSIEGEWEGWEALSPTLLPLLRGDVADFATWASGITAALAAGEPSLTVQLPSGAIWTQPLGGPQKYHARSFTELRSKFKAVRESPALELLCVQLHCPPACPC